MKNAIIFLAGSILGLVVMFAIGRYTGQVGRYQLVAASVPLITASSAKDVDRVVNSELFKIDSKTGHVWIYVDYYLVDKKKRPEMTKEELKEAGFDDEEINEYFATKQTESPPIHMEYIGFERIPDSAIFKPINKIPSPPKP